jgi:hypothetical protein
VKIVEVAAAVVAGQDYCADYALLAALCNAWRKRMMGSGSAGLKISTSRADLTRDRLIFTRCYARRLAPAGLACGRALVGMKAAPLQARHVVDAVVCNRGAWQPVQIGVLACTTLFDSNPCRRYVVVC